MSEHAWVLENIAGYVAGGLAVEERERLAEHVGICAACAAALEETEALDRRLVPLFVADRPEAALEDWLIQSLREVPERRSLRRLPWKAKVALSAAAGLLLAVVGAGVSELIESERLGFPTATNNHSATARSDPHSLPGADDGETPRHSSGHAWFAEIKGKRDESPQVGRDIVGGTILAKPVAPKNADQLAAEIHDKTMASVADGRIPLVPMFDDASAAERKFKVKVHDGKTPSATPATSSPPVAAPVNQPPPVSAGGGYFDAQQQAKTPVAKSADQPMASAGAPGPRGDLAIQKKSPDPAFFKPADTFNGTITKSESKEVGKSLGGPDQAEMKRDVGQKGAGKDGPSADKGDSNKDGKQEEAVQMPRLPVDGVAIPGLSAYVIKKKKEDESTTAVQQKAPEPAKPAPQASGRKIIRSGEVEFEVDSFDAAVATVMRLVTAVNGGFVATINSDKLANGKVRGSVVVRVPPERLDKLLLDIRTELKKTGDLKNQRIGSLDITKQYTDMESRLKAARTMEERLLKIIKEGKGQIKDLLLAEKELGVWRTKIEELEGELRYYANMVSLSTLTVNLVEKEIRTAALVTESERIQAGIEVEDVDKARQEALKAILDAKGRVTRAELKQHAAGQFNAILNFEVDADQAGGIRDRLRQLGTMVRLEIDRVQHTEGGGPAPRDGKVKRGPAQFFVSIYNLANVAPRETITIKVAAADVPAAYAKLREAVANAKGRVVNAQLNEQNRQNVTATVDFDVRRTGEGAVQEALKEAGDIVSRFVTRVPESDNVTDAKVLFRVELLQASAIPPRETVVLKVAVLDVPAAYKSLRDTIAKVKGSVANAQLSEQDRQNISAHLDFDVRRGDEPDLQKTLTEAGDVLSRQVSRLPEGASVTDSKVLFKVDLVQSSTIPPRETVTLKMAVVDVPAAYKALRDSIAQAKATVVNAQLNEQDRQNITAHLDLDVRRTDEGIVQKALAAAGDVLSRQVNRLPEGNNVTDTKVLFKIDLVDAATIAPRETTTLAMEVNDVGAALTLLQAEAKELNGRAVEPAQIGRERNGRVTARVVYDVPLAAASTLVEKLKAAHEVRVFRVTPNPQAPAGKLALARIEVVLSNAELLVPQDAGLWAQIRHGLSFSLRGLSVSASWLVVGVLFILPWLLLLAAIVWLVRRLWRVETIPSAPAPGSAPTP